MLTSQHWPQGAAFLNDLHATVDVMGVDPESAGSHPLGRVDAFFIEPANPYALLSCFYDGHPSAHVRLHATILIERCRTSMHAFLGTGAALPGLAAHGLRPGFRCDIHLHRHADQERRSTRGKMMLHTDGQAFQTDLGFSEGYALFGGHQSDPDLLEISQNLLNAVDTLCEATPSADAPWWKAERYCGFDEAMIPLGVPFQANSPTDAMAIAPILAWDWTNQHTIAITPHAVV